MAILTKNLMTRIFGESARQNTRRRPRAFALESLEGRIAPSGLGLTGAADIGYSVNSGISITVDDTTTPVLQPPGPRPPR